jgi:DNA-directed RNA polymerase specialized sigma24 family protein
LTVTTWRHDGIPDAYLARCSDRERMALTLAYEADLSGPEIADALGCTRKAANLLLIRGRAKVQRVAA